MLSHPGSVDVLDGTSPTITGLGYEAHLMQHNLSNNTLSPFTVSKPNSKQLISQNSYQGTPTGYSHSRNASMTASMEVIYINEAQNISVCLTIAELESVFIHYIQNILQALRASSQSSEENYCVPVKNHQGKVIGQASSSSGSKENIEPNSPNTKKSLQIQLLPHQQGSFPTSPKTDR